MGKSSKKVKNDRINSLRKQYDAFLEEDKKRKERNEYILGKLDKMRLSTSLVATTIKGTYLEVNPSDFQAPSIDLRRIPAIHDNYVTQLERKHVNESTILNEITKKYILIPKRSIPIGNEYTSTQHKGAIDDNEWKSKYNILADLKKLEKESHTDTVQQNNDLFVTSQRELKLHTDDKLSYNIDKDSYDLDKSLCKKDNIMEKGKNMNKINFVIPETNNQPNDENRNSLQLSSLSPDKGLEDSTMRPDQDSIMESDKNCWSSIEQQQLYSDHNLTQNIGSHFEAEKENNNNQLNFQENKQQSNCNQITGKTSEYERQENVAIASYPEEVITDLKPQETSAVELLQENLSEKHESVNYASENPELQSVGVHDDVGNNPDIHIISNQTNYDSVQYCEPSQIDVPSVHENTEQVDQIDHARNLQDLKSTGQINTALDSDPIKQLELNQSTYDATQHNEPTQDTTPVIVENTENTENVNVDYEINEFETEQREMFYNEQTFDGNDTYAYNEGDPNAGQYTGEDYERNNQYEYYEGVQQEQADSTYINEHEESTERYDPHYNQQYDPSYGNQEADSAINYVNTNYEQQQLQDESYQKQEFENVVNHENTQDNRDLYATENASNENQIKDTIIVPQDSQFYDENFYAEQPNIQQHIEQQLIAEEGIIENSQVIVDECQKEDENEAKKSINNIANVTTPTEQIPNP